MAIRRLKVSNFRSFNELDIELGDFNVLIGANASGKSNFVEIFRFLRDVQKVGLRSAVALQGGKRYVQNLRLGVKEPLSVDLTDDQAVGYGVTWKDDESTAVYVHVTEMNYGFSLGSAERDNTAHADGWHILRDSVERRFSAHRQDQESWTAKAGRYLGEGTFTARQENGRLVPTFDVDSQIREPFLDHVTALSIDPKWFPPGVLLLESRYFPLLFAGKPVPPFGTVNDLAIYRIDANSSQEARQVRSPAALAEDAGNLAPVISHLLSDAEQRRTLMNLVRYLLPFIHEIGVQQVSDDWLLLDVAEKYTSEKRIPASLISEGTINAVALVVALYFEEKPLVIFEDPDRGMHPKLMSRMVEMMKEVSKDKQIIVTTHHPEMVRYAGVENLLLVSRDEDGFSQISRPADKKMVKQFLSNDIGLDQLYVDDLLEV